MRLGRSVPAYVKKDEPKVVSNELADVMTGRKGSEQSRGGKAPNNSAKRDQIDDNLRRVYDDLLEDEVPDRFEDLLRQLREQDQK